MTNIQSRLKDYTLGKAESALREGGFTYPLAWMASFLVDHHKELRDSLLRCGKNELASQLGRLVSEIKTGQVAE